MTTTIRRPRCAACADGRHGACQHPDHQDVSQDWTCCCIVTHHDVTVQT